MSMDVAFSDDVRYSVRALARTPGATLALVVSAGIGIGANAVVFGFIGHLVDPAVVLPVTGADGVQARLDTIRTLLVAGATFVFVIAAATVAGLLLSRGAARVHETSVRVALGAHGRDLFRPLLAEGLVVAVAAVAVGLLAAWWTSSGLPAMFYREDAEALPFVVDWRGLALATGVGVMVAVGGALAPLVWTSRRRPAPDSRGTGPGLANTFGGWRSTLVIGQLTLCAVVLISTGAVLDRLAAALRTDHAERTGHTLVVRLEKVVSVAPYLTVLRDTFGDPPVGLTHVLPAGRTSQATYRHEPALPDSEGLTLDSNIIGGTHLDLVGLTLVLGRAFDARDTVRSRTVVLVNEEAAHVLTRESTSLLGLRLIDTEGHAVEVIGLVREAPFRSLQPRPRPTLYFAYAQRYPSTLSMVVSLNGPVSDGTLSSLAAIKDGRVTSVTTMQEHLALTSTAADRLITTVVRVFAALAVLLSLIGVTGVTSDVVARRTPEIALRMALGAPRWRIVAGVVSYGGRLGAMGALGGAVICLAAFRFVEPMLDGSRGPGVWVWAGGLATLMTVAILGAIVPARRALAVDPALLLRE